MAHIQENNRNIKSLKEWLLRKAAKRAIKFRKFLPYNRIGDRIYIYIDFILVHNRTPGTTNLFNDHLYKLYTSNEIIDPIRQFTSDKEFSKIFSMGILGYDVAVPTLKILRTEGEILDYQFPDRCVIKATHSAGMTVIRENGAQIDRQKICSWLNTNFYQVHREANYKYLCPKIIVEPKLFEGSNVDDFKIFCFDGKAKAVLFVRDRYRQFGRAFFDLSWNELDVGIDHRLTEDLPVRPSCLDQVIELTERLAVYFGLVRIDWYIRDDEFYLGEISHGHMRGLERFSPEESENILTNVIFS